MAIFYFNGRFFLTVDGPTYHLVVFLASRLPSSGALPPVGAYPAGSFSPSVHLFPLGERSCSAFFLARVFSDILSIFFFGRLGADFRVGISRSLF